MTLILSGKVIAPRLSASACVPSSFQKEIAIGGDPNVFKVI